MRASHFFLIRKTIFKEVFGDKDVAYFWEACFLPMWLPLLLGLGLGMFLALLIAKEAWHFLIPVALAVPAIALFSRYPFVGVMVWMLLLPYFLNEPTRAGRAVYWILHRAMIPSALGIVILSDWLGIRRIIKKEPIQLGRAELAMVLFLGLTLANVFLLSGNPVRSLIELYDQLFVPFCMYGLIRLTAPREKDLKRFLWVAFITLVAQCAIGLLAWFAPQALPRKWINTATRGARTVGSLWTEAVYTSTLLFLALWLFQYAMNCKSKRVRHLLLAACGLAFFCVFFSFSRASWIGGLTVLVGLICSYPKTTILLTIILVMLASILGGSILADEVAFAYERLTSEAAQKSAENRVIVNNALIRMTETKPFFGWGRGDYRLHSQQFITQVGNISLSLGYGVASHNTYLTMMAELGLITFFLYIFPVGWWLMLSIKVRRRLPSRGFSSCRLLGMLWLSMLNVFIVSNFMDMGWFVFGTTLWWMALALIANLVYPYLKPDDIGAPSWARQSINPPVC
jgi:O-antigen ligase